MQVKRSLRRAGALCGAVAVFGLAGCVPYQTYQDTKAKLEQAQLANRDLVRKINQAQMRIKELEARGGQGGVSQEEYAAALAELTRLRQQLEKQPTVNLPFEKEDFEKVKGSTPEPGGGMRLGEALLFNEGESKLKASQLPILDQLAELLKTKYRGETIIIEGHTDNKPLEKTKALYKDNWNLGYQRARSVYEYLLQKGVPKENMILMTYGYSKPIDPATADTPEGRKLNRRVVIRRAGAKI